MPQRTVRTWKCSVHALLAGWSEARERRGAARKQVAPFAPSRAHRTRAHAAPRPPGQQGVCDWYVADLLSLPRSAVRALSGPSLCLHRTDPSLSPALPLALDPPESFVCDSLHQTVWLGLLRIPPSLSTSIRSAAVVYFGFDSASSALLLHRAIAIARTLARSRVTASMLNERRLL